MLKYTPGILPQILFAIISLTSLLFFPGLALSAFYASDPSAGNCYVIQISTYAVTTGYGYIKTGSGFYNTLPVDVGNGFNYDPTINIYSGFWADKRINWSVQNWNPFSHTWYSSSSGKGYVSPNQTSSGKIFWDSPLPPDCSLIPPPPEPPLDCTTATVAQVQSASIAWADLNCDGGSQYLTNYVCETQSGTCRPPSCNDLLSDCINKCSNNIVPDSFSCIGDPGNLITTECLCVGQASSSSHSTDLPIYSYDELTGEMSLDGVPLGSNSTTTDKATVQNTAAINDNITHQTETINNALTNITNSVTNNSTTTNNTLTNVDNSVKNVSDSIGTLDTNLGSKLDEISSKLDSTVSYNPLYITDNSTSSDNETGQFTTRFNTFFSDLKATPLFSLPNQVLFSIPDSTTSIYSFDMGSYGQYDFDFADYATPLLILRSCFLICFSYAGLRIVVSKK